MLQTTHKLVKLAIPLTIGQLSQMLITLADTKMIGRLGAEELAVQSFVNSLFYLPFVFGLGLLAGISVISSNAYGSKDHLLAQTTSRIGWYLAIGLGVLFILISWWLKDHLAWFQQPEEVTKRAPLFFFIIMSSLLPTWMSMVLKSHADALNKPWVPFWIFMSGVVLNILFNYLFMYGFSFIPALGLEGAAWGSLLARIIICVAMWIWINHSDDLKAWVPQKWLQPIEWQAFKKVWAIGWPTSLHMITEVGAFTSTGILIGLFGYQALASHQIALTCASIAFMLPLGFSQALMVQTGQAFGAKDYNALKKVVHVGWVLSFLLGSCTAILFLNANYYLASSFIQDPKIIKLAATLIIITGIFQLVDSVQVCSASMLRSLDDSKITAWIGMFSYWVIAPLTVYILAFRLEWGAAGVWYGLATGLGFASIALSWRLHWKLRLYCPK